MKLISIILAGLLVSTFYVCAEEITKIIAKVNNEVITSRDLSDYCLALAYQDYSGLDESSCRNPELQLQILGRLIEDRLILAKARDEQFQIPRYLIEKQFNKMVAAYPSREEFEESLVQRGLNVTRVKERIKEQYLMQLVIEKYVKSFVSVSPQEVSDYYEQNLDEFYSPIIYIFYMAKSEDQEILKEISGVIIEEGILGAKEKYNDILFRVESNKAELKEEISRMIEKLEVGGHIIGKSDGTFYLIYLKEVIESELIALEDVKERIYEHLKEVKFKKRFKEWINEVKSNSVIKIYYE